MGREKLVFALLVCVLVACLAFLAMQAIPRQPVAFFAYGANLAKSTMEARAGGYLNATEAALPGYELAFASQDARSAEFGVATPVKNGGAAVQGALYYLTPSQMAALDRQSGVPKFYERKEVRVLAGGNEMSAQAYFLSGATQPAPPSRAYYLAAKSGLIEWGYGTAELDAAVAAAAGN